MGLCRHRALAALLLALGCGGDPNGAPVTQPTCGNGRLDPGEDCDRGIPAGMPGACPTTCDDANSCTTDRLDGAGTCNARCVHDTVPNCCGNGQLEAGEVCDDGNQQPFDGCSPSCQLERALVWQTAALLDGAHGCDLTGDGHIDNAFGGAMNATARNFFSDELTREDLEDCDAASLWLFEGADPQMNAAFRVSFLQGWDTDDPPVHTDYFTGQEPLYVTSAGQPATPLSGMAPGGMMSMTAGTVAQFPMPWCLNKIKWLPLQLSNVSLSGTLTGGPDGPAQFSGMLCDARSAGSWHRFPNSSGFGGMTLLDLIVVGADFLGFHANPTEPDIDVDGDGLEILQDTDGDGNVDLCIDGNGAHITGTDCPLDPRIADAYSEAYQVTAVRAVLAGRQP